MSGRKFPWGRTFVVGFGFLGISLIWPIFNQYIPIFLQAGNKEFEAQLLAEGRKIPAIVGFGLTPALALFIMTWDNIINIFIQPWVGARSDRTWNRFGRRKGWILLGVPVAALSFIFIPVAQSVLAIMVFILITNFGMSLFRSPTVSWLGDLFASSERSKANGVINLMGGVGGLGIPCPAIGGTSRLGEFWATALDHASASAGVAFLSSPSRTASSKPAGPAVGAVVSRNDCGVVSLDVMSFAPGGIGFPTTALPFVAR